MTPRADLRVQLIAGIQGLGESPLSETHIEMIETAGAIHRAVKVKNETVAIWDRLAYGSPLLPAKLSYVISDAPIELEVSFAPIQSQTGSSLVLTHFLEKNEPWMLIGSRVRSGNFQANIVDISKLRVRESNDVLANVLLVQYFLTS